MKISEYPPGAVTEPASLVIGDTLYFWCAIPRYSTSGHPQIGKGTFNGFSRPSKFSTNSVTLGHFDLDRLYLDAVMSYRWGGRRGFFFKNFFMAWAYVCRENQS